MGMRDGEVEDRKFMDMHQVNKILTGSNVERVLERWNTSWFEIFHLANLSDELLDEFEHEGVCREDLTEATSTLLSLSMLKQLALALADCDTDSPAIAALQLRSEPDLLDVAQELMQSQFEIVRNLGVCLIMRQTQTPFRQNSIELIKNLVSLETSPSVLASICYALKHLQDETRGEVLKNFVRNESVEVREAVAFSFSGLNNDLSVKSLAILANDDDEEVRDWAVCALTSIEYDLNAESSNSLSTRLNDSSDEIRCNAMYALARRKDNRCRDTIIQFLTSKAHVEVALKAACNLADPILYPILRELESDKDIRGYPYLQDAMQTCKP